MKFGERDSYTEDTKQDLETSCVFCRIMPTTNKAVLSGIHLEVELPVYHKEQEPSAFHSR